MKKITFGARTYKQVLVAYEKLRTRYKKYRLTVAMNIKAIGAGLYTGTFSITKIV